MNISGGKDVLKFFSKNKKGVSVPEEYEKKFPNADTKRIRKDNIVVHSSGKTNAHTVGISSNVSCSARDMA